MNKCQVYCFRIMNFSTKKAVQSTAFSLKHRQLIGFGKVRKYTVNTKGFQNAFSDSALILKLLNGKDAFIANGFGNMLGGKAETFGGVLLIILGLKAFF